MTEDRIIFFQQVSRFVIRVYEELGIEVLLFWFHRTDDQQKSLYAIGRTIELHRKPVTNCDGVTTHSKHERWLAVDFVIVEKGVLIWTRVPGYEEMGRIAKEEGMRWGGDWDGDEVRDPNDFDIYHFEYRRAA